MSNTFFQGGEIFLGGHHSTGCGPSLLSCVCVSLLCSEL